MFGSSCKGAMHRPWLPEPPGRIESSTLFLQEPTMPPTLMTAHRNAPGRPWPIGFRPDISSEPHCLTVTQRALKRSVDITGALVFFVLLGPLYLLVAAAVFIGMGGPVHYGQTRLGH